MLATQWCRKKTKMRATSYLLREWCWTLRRTLPLLKEAYHSCLSNTVFPLRYKIVFLLRLSLIWWMTSWTCSYQSNLFSTLPSHNLLILQRRWNLLNFLPSLPLLYGHLFDEGMVAMFLWCPYRGTDDCDKCQLCLGFLYGHGVTSVIETSAGNEARRTELCFFNYIQVLK